MTPVHVAFEITPLTHTTRDGNVYERRKEVILQLEELSISTEEVLARRIRVEREDEQDSIKSEALVFLYRTYLGTDLSNTIYDVLALRIRMMVLQFRGRFAQPEVDFEDFLQSMHFAVLEKITDPSDAGDYAQVSFGDFVVSLAGNFLKKAETQNKRKKITDSIEETIDGSEDAPSRITIVAKGVSPDKRLLLEEAINSMSEINQKAWLLYHVEGYQIESKNPAETTIATLLGVTGRTVRNRLNEAQKQLENWKGGFGKAL